MGWIGNFGFNVEPLVVWEISNACDVQVGIVFLVDRTDANTSVLFGQARLSQLRSSRL